MGILRCWHRFLRVISGPAARTAPTPDEAAASYDWPPLRIEYEQWTQEQGPVMGPGIIIDLNTESDKCNIGWSTGQITEYSLKGAIFLVAEPL